MKRIWRWFKESFLKIARIDSTPVKIAVGIGLGAFIAIFPITGFQFLTGLFLSIIFRVNKIAVVVTTQLVCNPLTLPFIIYLDFKVGEKILKYNSSLTIQSIRLLLKEINFRNFFSVLGNIAKPTFLGSATIAPIIALIAFVLGYFLIKKFKIRGKKSTCPD